MKRQLVILFISIILFSACASYAEQTTADKAVESKKKEETPIAMVGLVTAAKSNIMSRPDKYGKLYYTCKNDTPLALIGQKGSYYCVLMSDYSYGWILKKDVKLLDCPVLASKSGSNGLGEKAVRVAFMYMGIPYKWGGSSASGLDCSAFVRAVYGSLGYSLPRVASDQARVGKSVEWKDLQPGDRLYFSCKKVKIDHTGIYIGNGNFIHSSISRGGVAIDSLMDDFYLYSLIEARRF